ncbi:MAG: C39 family peptidase [Bacillota bacterium]
MLVVLVLFSLLLGCSAEETSNQQGGEAAAVIDKVEVTPSIVETNSKAKLKVKLADKENNYDYKWELINDEAGELTGDGAEVIYQAGTKTGKYKIKVIVSNNTGEKVYTEKTIEVKEEVTDGGEEFSTQETKNNLGVWLWYLPDTKYDSHNNLAKDLNEMGAKRAYVKVNDEGASHYFKSYLDNSVVEAYENQNLEVWAWGYNYPHSISEQAEALYQAAKVGYEGYVLDVEKEFESNSNSLVELVKAVNDAKQRAINNGYIEENFKIYLSSYGNIMSHEYINLEAIDQYLDGYMPQTYLEVWGDKYMQNPEKYVELDKEEYRQAGATKAIHNVISVEYGDIKTSQINRAFQTAGSEASIWRVPRWNGEDPASDKQWQIIKDIDWGMYGEDAAPPVDDENLTINPPQKIVKGQQVEFAGKVPEQAEKVMISVDGYPLTNQAGEKYIKTNNGSYELNYTFDSANKDRRLVINAFDKNGDSIKQLSKTIDVMGDEEIEGDNLGSEFAKYVNDNWRSLKDEAMSNISEGTDCVAFVSAALRDFGYDIHATVTDGITGSQTKEDTLVYNLFAAGFKKSEDISQLKPGDICFTEPEYYSGVELSNPYTPDQREGYFPNHTYIFMNWVDPSSTKYAWVVDNQGERHKRNMSVSGEHTQFGYFMHLPRDNTDSDDETNEPDSDLTVQLPDKIEVDERIKIKGQATGKIHKVIISVDDWKLDEVIVEDNEYKLTDTFDQAGRNRKLIIKAFDKNGKTIKEIKKEINVGGAEDEVISDVPYYYQYHNEINGDGSCQNSAIAAVLNYYGWDGAPDTISSSDFGTGTAQTPEGLEEVFNHYARNSGLDVRVNGHRHGNMDDLNQLLAAGKPVIVHGYFTGYGHVITLVGYDGTYYYANDSAGKWDQNYKGDYHHSAAAGEYVKYHKSNVKDAVYSSDGKLWYHEIYFE